MVVVVVTTTPHLVDVVDEDGVGVVGVHNHTQQEGGVVGLREGELVATHNNNNNNSGGWVGMWEGRWTMGMG